MQYETATEEEKAEFDVKNTKKVEALEYAIDLLSCETRVFRLREMVTKIGEHIDGVIEEYANDLDMIEEYKKTDEDNTDG